MKERYRGSTEYEIQKKLAEYATWKAVCMFLNAALALLSCILSGKLWLGIVTAVIIVLAALYFYILQSMPMEFNGRLTTRRCTLPVMIVSWPIALAVTLLAVILAGKLGSLWVWITVGFVVSLFLQMFMWPMTVKWAQRQVQVDDDSEGMSRLFEQACSGRAKCASCGKTISGKCAITCKDGRGGILCDECLPGRDGEWTEVQGMHFMHVDTSRMPHNYGFSDY